MKNLLACLAVFAAFSVSAQQFSPPWNPDADDNGSIGAADVLATLSVYGNEWGVNTSLTCDYVPSDSEQWFLDVLTGEVIIDSLFFQQIQLTSTEVFVIGCPEPVIDTLVIEQTTWLFPYNIGLEYPLVYFEDNTSPNEGFAFCGMGFSQGEYSFYLEAQPANSSSIENAGFPFDSWWEHNTQLPFGSGFILNESGIDGDMWNSPNDYVQFIQLIPYWHYDE